jgi:hypothetical protein
MIPSASPLIQSHCRFPPLGENGFVTFRRPDSSSQTFYANEATKEIHSGHPLHGQTFTTFANCSACDDVAFSMTDGSFVIVHLTYNTNERPPWPRFTNHRDYAALLAAMNEHAVESHSDTMD